MASDNRVLTQADIDAMLSAQSEAAAEQQQEEPEPPVLVVRQEASAPAELTDNASSPEDLGSILSTIANITERLEKIEGVAGKVSQLEKAMSQMSATASGPKGQASQQTVEQLQALSNRVEEVWGHLKDTLGYRAKQTFTCDRCGQHGTVATPIKCTNCGKQNWWGWWPKKK